MAEFRAAWWWIDRWRKSTAYTDMTAEAQGVYRNLLDELWLRDGILPLADKALAQISGDYRAWERVRDVVLDRFTKTPGGYRNATHDEVAGKSKELRDFHSLGGKARAATAQRAGGKFTSKLGQQADQQEVQHANQPPDQSPDQSPEPTPNNEIRATRSSLGKNPEGAKKGRGRPKIEPSPEAHEIAEYLRDAILEWNPEHACARNGQAKHWARDIDLALRIDKRSPKSLVGAIDYAHRKNTWWRPNILSGKKLRAQFDALKAQAIRDRNVAEAKPENVDALSQWLGKGNP